MQGRELDKKSITLPEIKELGTYDATVKLHPEVRQDLADCAVLAPRAAVSRMVVVGVVVVVVC